MPDANSCDPTLLNISKADKEEPGTKNSQQCDIGQDGHPVTHVEGAMENIGAVGHRKYKESVRK